MSRVVVIGAGISGLASAALLAKDGHDVTIFEQHDHIGGRTRTIFDDEFRFETGPSWYLMPDVYEHFFTLFSARRSDYYDLVRLDPAYHVFAQSDDGKAAERHTVHSAPQQLRDLVATRDPHAARRLPYYLDSARKSYELAREYFLYNPYASGSSLMRRDILRQLPQLIDVLRTPLSEYASRLTNDRVVQQILTYPAVFLGTDPRRAPALYHLMSHMDLTQGVFYPQGGFTAVTQAIAHLAHICGADVVTNAQVKQVVTARRGSRNDVIGVQWQDATGKLRYAPADIVVCATDLHHGETQLLPPKLRSYSRRWWSRCTPGPSGVVANLAVRGRVSELGHHNLFFTRDWDTNFDAVFTPGGSLPTPTSLYVCKPSHTDHTVAPEGHENIFVLIPTAASVKDQPRQANCAASDPAESPDRIVDQAIAQVSRWADIPDLADRIMTRHVFGPDYFATYFNSWRASMLGPAHTLTQSAMFRAKNKSRKVRGLYYAGGTVNPGIGVPMCLISAQNVLKLVRGDTSPGPLEAADNSAVDASSSPPHSGCSNTHNTFRSGSAWVTEAVDGAGAK